MAEKFAPFPGAICIEPGSDLWKEILGNKGPRDDSHAQIRRRKQEEKHAAFMKEYEAFLKQWEDSEGFDLDSVPDDLDGGPCVFNDLEVFCESGYLKSARGCAMFAIDHENKQKGSKTKLEFVDLVKFNLVRSREDEYYLTFRAKDRRDGSVSAYQALVTAPNLKEFNQGKAKVLKFRERKPSTHELSKGVESLSMDVARDAAALST